MVVENVVWHWMYMIVEYDKVINDGLGHAAGRSMGVFYVEDGFIVYQEPEWLQGDLNIIIELFQHIGLMVSAAKSKIIMCQPGIIRSGMSEEAMGQQSMGKGDTYR